MPGAVLKFQSLFPEVEVRLFESFAHVTMPLVRDHTLDMALGPKLPGYRRDAGLKYRPVFHNEQVVIGRKGHPLAKARSAHEHRPLCRCGHSAHTPGLRDGQAARGIGAAAGGVGVGRWGMSAGSTTRPVLLRDSSTRPSG